MKTCTKCKETKNSSEFRIRSRGGSDSYCLSCRRAYDRQYYQKSTRKTDVAENHRIAVKRLQHQIDKIKSHYGCQHCKESESLCLDFHHIDTTTKFDTISNLTCKNNKTRLAEEINKCIVLCHNCHRRFHAGRISIRNEPCQVKLKTSDSNWSIVLS